MEAALTAQEFPQEKFGEKDINQARCEGPDTAAKTDTANPTDANDRANHFLSLAAEVVGDRELKRKHENEAAVWFSRAGRPDLAHECLRRVAQSYIDEAVERTGRDRCGIMITACLVEASRTILKLPPEYRSAHGLDDQLEVIRRELIELDGPDDYLWPDDEPAPK